MGTGVLIPYLVGQTVNEIDSGGANLWPLALAVAGAGVFRLAFSVSRRLVAGRVSLGVEYDLRNRMYEHLHSLELAFFDTQQTGPADVALDRGPAVRALLPRLRAHLHRPVGVHDPDRRRRDARGRPDAGRDRAGADAVRDLGVVPLRAPQPAGDPGGTAAHRGADRGGRGEHLRRARRQGVRAGGAPAAALLARGRARLRPVDGLDAPARLLRAASSASSPSSGSPQSSSSAAARRSTARSPSATSSRSTATC